MTAQSTCVICGFVPVDDCPRSGCVAAIKPRLNEPCAFVEKMRAAEKFEPYCVVHNHWLNGAPAERFVDRFMREIQQDKPT